MPYEQAGVYDKPEPLSFQAVGEFHVFDDGQKIFPEASAFIKSACMYRHGVRSYIIGVPGVLRFEMVYENGLKCAEKRVVAGVPCIGPPYYHIRPFFLRCFEGDLERVFFRDAVGVRKEEDPAAAVRRACISRPCRAAVLLQSEQFAGEASYYFDRSVP